MADPTIEVGICHAFAMFSWMMFADSLLTRLFALERNHILNVVSVREHVHWTNRCDHIVLAEDLEVACL